MHRFLSVALLISAIFALADSSLVDDVFDSIRKDKFKKLSSLLAENAATLGDFINIRDPKGSGQTPLMMAVLMGKEEAVRVLLEKDEVDLTIPEKDGYTPFHGAGFQGRANILRLLLKDRRAALDPEELHKDGFSPMHRACWGTEKRHTDTVAVFIEEGKVPWNQATSKGKTCRDITYNQATKQWLGRWADKLPKPVDEL